MITYVALDAEPGENVQDTARRAIELANETKLSVSMRHNDRVVRVEPGHAVEAVLARWDHQGEETQKRHAIGHVWLAYFSDRSELVIFADETECLRYAVKNQLSVAKWDFGTSFDQAVRGE